ncbi:MAG: electron transfer flavoprotein subunit alpha/FixB family protein [Candidatus Rokubacteria bacterium]|nr:electron transfer flavoprotein subunit alpha/FixB family protein [Candidatus Rokubacteria bacterium]
MSEWDEPVWLVTDAGDGPEPGRAPLEGLAQAQALARAWGGGVRVILLAAGDVRATLVEAWRAFGADPLAVVRGPALASPEVRARVEVVETLLGRGRPLALVVSSCEYAEAWAPRLAARRRLPAVTRCVEAVALPGGLRVRREVCRGKAHLSLDFDLTGDRVPAVLLLEPGSWAVPARTGELGARGTVETIHLSAAPDVGPVTGVGRVRRILPNPGEIDLEDAHLVLGGGGGLGSPKGFAALRETARELGAAVGASRIAVDRGWARPEEQVGLTGRQISPRVYVAFGISGAREHLSGVAEVEHLVAVNLDPRAPIAGVSRLFAVADAQAVVRALAAEARRRVRGAAGADRLSRVG